MPTCNILKLCNFSILMKGVSETSGPLRGLCRLKKGSRNAVSACNHPKIPPLSLSEPAVPKRRREELEIPAKQRCMSALKDIGAGFCLQCSSPPADPVARRCTEPGILSTAANRPDCSNRRPKRPRGRGWIDVAGIAFGCPCVDIISPVDYE